VRRVPAGLLGLALALVAAETCAQSPPPDTALGGYLRQLSDSTDRYFGLTAAPLDTAGLDSALAAELQRSQRRDRRLGLSLAPWLAFQRVDGTKWGARVGVGRTRDPVQLVGRLGYAVGSERWLGGGEIRGAWTDPGSDAEWSLRLSAGRFTAVMDPDRGESTLGSLRALVAGADNQRYLRRDGVRAAVERETPLLRLTLGIRDELESPLAVTTTWNLLDRTSRVVDNLPAAAGRAREAELTATVRLGPLPVWIEASHANASRELGSELEYRRTRGALAAELELGPVASVIPQLAFGWLAGEPAPQAAFYLGGAHSIRSLRSVSRGGTRSILARLDVIAAPDLATLIGLPHSSALAWQAGAFGGMGVVWGVDPYGGPAVPHDRWPERDAWAAEFGASLLYRPGLPDPGGYVRLDYAFPIEGADGSRRLAVYYSQPIDLLRPTGR
jgi:hypothetical protein